MVEGDKEREESVTIRGPAWTAIEIPITRDEATNYLGCMIDFNYSGKASKEEMTQIAKASTAAIIGCLTGDKIDGGLETRQSQTGL